MEIETTSSALNEALKEHFGFDKFKGRQEEIIKNILEGRDTFVIMPTGGGKSLCYQLPAVMLPGTALIISPLIALMKNQVDSIRGYSENSDVAHFLNSSLNKGDERHVRECVLDGRTKILFVAPETLTKEENVEFFRKLDISFVAVDEAHCISEWGHDFRPEYRKIRQIVDAIGDRVPIIALTATATPKVQQDIQKNLGMDDVNKFISSFNRDNLYYEVRPKLSKPETAKSIVQIVKTMPGQSGIIYVQSRKATEEIAQILRINDIKASAYHAGLDSKTRTRVQDDFLMERTDVICATIAFGMGIDKPDVRFVIHYDSPKSIENYYQETGRAGRDGLKGHCVAFFSHKDISRLEKFLRDKTAAERQMGAQLLEEISAYCETAVCRRQFLLQYFGEEYRDDHCMDMCDNCRHPKTQAEVSAEMHLALSVIKDLSENYPVRLLNNFITGSKTKDIVDYRYDQRDLFAKGKAKSDNFWSSIFRKAMLEGLVYKSVEDYGVLKLTDEGTAYIKKPKPLMMAENHDFSKIVPKESDSEGGTAVLDQVMLDMLRDTRRKIAGQKNIPPYIIFQDPSLEEMATRYPCTMSELSKITGVSQGKASKYGKPFIELISLYVEENDIEREADFVMKQVANKSRTKVQIIQGIDKKIPLEDIAKTADMHMEELLHEMYQIVSAGTKVNIDYYIEDNVDEYSAEDIEEYFMEAESDDLETAFAELKEDDITREEIELMRIKFLSQHAN